MKKYTFRRRASRLQSSHEPWSLLSTSKIRAPEPPDGTSTAAHLSAALAYERLHSFTAAPPMAAAGSASHGRSRCGCARKLTPFTAIGPALHAATGCTIPYSCAVRMATPQNAAPLHSCTERGAPKIRGRARNYAGGGLHYAARTAALCRAKFRNGPRKITFLEEKLVALCRPPLPNASPGNA